ncbi:MAG: flagellin [Thermodesulfobacteriota bacterium]
MRVSQENQYRTVLNDISQLQYQQFVTQRQITTNRKVNLPSEARNYAVTILDSQNVLRESDQYGSNLEASASWLKASESSMDSLTDLLGRAKVLAEQLATGTVRETEHESSASEVMNLIEQITSLANTQVGGSYIFGGSRTDRPPITALLRAAGPSQVFDQGPAGHGTQASVQAVGGVYRLRLARDSVGSANTITVPQDALSNTLGAGLGLDFDSWTQDQAASASLEDVWSSGQGLAGPDSAVSDRIGEALNWQAAAAAGVQTFRTRGLVSFGGGAAGAAQVTVGADTYTVAGATAAASAADLVEQINADPARGYFAWVENGVDVYIMSKDGATFTLAETADPGGVMGVDASTSLSELAAAINSGQKAMGTVHLDDGSPPLGADVITLGANVWTWTEIIAGIAPPPASAAEYAAALAAHVNSHSGDFTATVSSSGTGATVQITAVAAGGAGNVALTSSNPLVGASGNLMGGLNGADSRGRLYLGGESSLRLNTEVRGEVTAVDAATGAVSVRLSWYDDEGAYQSADVDLASAGQGGQVLVPGLGGVSLYRDSLNYKLGAVFSLQLGRYQGNQDPLEVNFSVNHRMQYNWTAQDLLGGSLAVNLDGRETIASPGNAGGGTVSLAGSYRGLGSRDFSLDVIDGGRAPDDDVTFRVSWRDDEGIQHLEDVTLSAGGLGGRVELPGGDGVWLEIDHGVFATGDNYHYRLEKSPQHLLDTLYQWHHRLTSGDAEAAQHQSQRTLEALGAVMQTVLDHQANLGTRSQRVTVREAVLTAYDQVHSTNLENLQDVDLTEAFISLRSQQTAYQTSLKVISAISELFLVKLL